MIDAQKKRKKPFSIKENTHTVVMLLHCPSASVSDDLNRRRSRTNFRLTSAQESGVRIPLETECPRSFAEPDHSGLCVRIRRRGARSLSMLALGKDCPFQSHKEHVEGTVRDEAGTTTAVRRSSPGFQDQISTKNP